MAYTFDELAAYSQEQLDKIEEEMQEGIRIKTRRKYEQVNKILWMQSQLED